jgi:pimeloyl-ACP methyl ester carboxylesterase
MGNTYPKRGDYEFIKRKTQDTFYSPDSASQELIDEIYDTVNDRGKALRIVMISKSAIRHYLGDELDQIKAPTLIIWGKNDNVTPPEVGEKFHELIPHSKLVWIDECGHAPMMEHPVQFNTVLEAFLNEVTAEKVA